MKLPTLFSLLLTGIAAQAQDIQWEQSYGGRQADYLLDAQPTPDYGFILAGSSLSRKSGNKTEAGKGDLDYWIWKMDENGKEEWQKSFGGTGTDMLYCVKTTNDGGFILGGISNSPKGMDKKDDARGGNDYWVIKLNAKGEEEWQKTLGGRGQDDLLCISPTADGGYIIGGSSNSDTRNNGQLPEKGDSYKAENSRGNMDYWILKLDSKGKVEWQRTLGGQYADVLRAIEPTRDGGYILGGYSNSPQSGEKTNANLGQGGDFWILKLDKKGTIEWQQTIGGEKDDQLYALHQTHDGGYIAAGNSNSPRTPTGKSIKDTDFLVMKLDTKGNVQWSEAYDFGKVDVLTSMVENKDHSFLVAGYSAQPVAMMKGKKKKEEGINDYIALKLSETGELLWNRSVGSDGEDVLRKVIETKDGGYLLAGTSDPESDDNAYPSDIKKDRNLKLGNGGQLEGARKVQQQADDAVNDATRQANDYIKEQSATVTNAIKGATGSNNLPLKVGGDTGNLLNTGKASGSNPGSLNQGTAADKGAKKGIRYSRDKATSFGGKDFWVVKLKDKDKKIEEREKIEALPNPAVTFTNIIIGYDYTKGTATVVDLAGRVLQTFAIKDKTVPVDLSPYPEGIYIVNIKTDKGEDGIKVIKNGN